MPHVSKPTRAQCWQEEQNRKPQSEDETKEICAHHTEEERRNFFFQCPLCNTAQDKRRIAELQREAQAQHEIVHRSSNTTRELEQANENLHKILGQKRKTIQELKAENKKLAEKAWKYDELCK